MSTVLEQARQTVRCWEITLQQALNGYNTTPEFVKDVEEQWKKAREYLKKIEQFYD